MQTKSLYKPQSSDTAIAAEIVLFNLWRSWPLLQRITHLNHHTKSARLLAWHMAQSTFAHQSQEQQIDYFLKKVLDHSLLNYLDSWTVGSSRWTSGMKRRKTDMP